MRIKIFRYTLLLITFAMFSLTHFSCDGPFPSESKSGLPGDHTDDQGGALHKGGKDDPRGDGDCSDGDCHQPDLRGGVVEFEGRIVITPSCYQCHGEKWDDEGDD